MAKLDKAKGAWAELLPQVLWAYRTSHRTSTGDTPYALAFGAEAVVPVEIGMATHRVEVFQAEANDNQMNFNLDLVDERRDHAQLRNASYQQRVARYYNSRVKH
ncbi:unnamed protein product [Prunus armeniaca]